MSPVVGIVVEIPTGALADRFSRRAALVAAGVLQGAGYLLWITVPGYPGFAAGFVLWGVGRTFSSGALEALLYEGWRWRAPAVTTPGWRCAGHRGWPPWLLRPQRRGALRRP